MRTPRALERRKIGSNATRLGISTGSLCGNDSLTPKGRQAVQQSRKRRLLFSCVRSLQSGHIAERFSTEGSEGNKDL